MSSANYWDKLMGSDANAAVYMHSYNEGPGCETRQIVSKYIKDGESVLDAGCGPGWNLDHFMQYGPAISKYKGIDYSERFVRIANERAMRLAGTATGPFELGDIRKLKEKRNSWDVVILQDVLEHTNGYKIPVKEALRVAKKRIIITFWRQWRTDGSGDQINDDGDDGYGATYEKADWEKFLNSLKYPWKYDHTSVLANRQHNYYVIYKDPEVMNA